MFRSFLPVKIQLERIIVMASYLDSPSRLENSTQQKGILKQRKCSEEFILTLMEGENDSLEFFFLAVRCLELSLEDILIQWRRYQ